MPLSALHVLLEVGWPCLVLRFLQSLTPNARAAAGQLQERKDKKPKPQRYHWLLGCQKERDGFSGTMPELLRQLPSLNCVSMGRLLIIDAQSLLTLKGGDAVTGQIIYK